MTRASKRKKSKAHEDDESNKSADEADEKGNEEQPDATAKESKQEKQAADSTDEKDERSSGSTTASASSSSTTAAASASASSSLAPRTEADQLRLDKTAYFATRPDLLSAVGRALLPLFFRACASAASSYVRYKCLSGVLRILYLTPAESLSSFLSPAEACGFLVSLLHSHDYPLMAAALQAADLLLHKMSATYASQFVREGLLQVPCVCVLIVLGH